MESAPTQLTRPPSNLMLVSLAIGRASVGLTLEPAKILVVDDEKSILLLLKEALTQWGYQVTTAPSAVEGLELLKNGLFDAIISDIRMPDMTGLDLLREIRKQDETIEVVMMTGYPTIASAVQALKEGAYDYLSKPLILDELRHLMARMMERRFLRGEVHTLRARLGEELTVNELIGSSQVMAKVKDIIGKVAVTDSPVLIEGESGTGKELVAKALHRLSSRGSFPFVALNCGAVPENLLESELFGHEKGAFTGALVRKPGLFEVADRGVLFLDEVGEVTGAVQVKLLRAIETKEFFHVGGTRPVRTDVRIVSATNKNLKVSMQEGNFREDLYYRLNGVTLKLPPLRDRRGDIPLLARHFMDRYAPKKKISAKGLEALQAYAWPGNVRELQMVIQRAAILAGGDSLGPEDLPLDVRDPSWKAAAVKTGLTLAEMEKEYITTVLAQNEGHRGRTAKALGIDPKTLYNKLGPERPRKR